MTPSPCSARLTRSFARWSAPFRTYAFNDINPKAKVHVLVVPKKHYANVAELAAGDPTELAHIVSIAQNIADKEFHGAYRLVFNTGLDAGQTVFHVHAHVMTGEKLDE